MENIILKTHLSQKPSEGSSLVTATSLLVLMGFSLLSWSRYTEYARLLPASGETVFTDGEYWRLFSTMFVHADLQHLLSNAIGFSAFSYLLYGYFGFKVFPCLSLGISAVVNLIALATYPPNTSLVGASGAIYFMAAFWLTLYIFLERRFPIGKRLLRAVGFMLIVLIPTSFSIQTSYRTHAISFFTGIVIAIPYFFANKERLRRAEVVEPEWE